MSIPRKGSRKVEVEGSPYLFIVKQAKGGNLVDLPDGTQRYEPDSVVTVQEDVERPGNVLQARFPYGFTVDLPVVFGCIQEAKKKGWNPSARGPAFVLKDEET